MTGEVFLAEFCIVLLMKLPTILGSLQGEDSRTRVHAQHLTVCTLQALPDGRMTGDAMA